MLSVRPRRLSLAKAGSQSALSSFVKETKIYNNVKCVTAVGGACSHPAGHIGHIISGSLCGLRARGDPSLTSTQSRAGASREGPDSGLAGPAGPWGDLTFPWCLLGRPRLHLSPPGKRAPIPRTLPAPLEGPRGPTSARHPVSGTQRPPRGSTPARHRVSSTQRHSRGPSGFRELAAITVVGVCDGWGSPPQLRLHTCSGLTGQEAGQLLTGLVLEPVHRPWPCPLSASAHSLSFLASWAPGHDGAEAAPPGPG